MSLTINRRQMLGGMSVLGGGLMMPRWLLADETTRWCRRRGFTLFRC